MSKKLFISLFIFLFSNAVNADLLERLISGGPEGDGKIAVHQFTAGMYEIAEGEITVAQFKNYFDLQGQDATDFDWLLNQYDTSADQDKWLVLIEKIFMLSEFYTPGYTDRNDVAARITRIP